MATELQIREHLDMMRSLPLPLARLANSIATTQWPGQPIRYNLPKGVTLSERDRTEIQNRLDQVNEIVTGSNLMANESAKARLSLLTKMLLAMPVGGSSSEVAAEARAEMYDDA